MNKRKYEVSNFEQSSMGIISSARIFGEGVDIKICDAICFADGKSSTVDIIQYIGRALRKCDKIPNKKANIIIPFVLDDTEEFLDNSNDSFLKIRKILQSIGTSDDMVSEKFTVIDYSNELKAFDKKFNLGISDKNEYIQKQGIVMTVSELGNSIITKIFDKTGDHIDFVRKKLEYENNRRINNGEELIDNEKKIRNFLNKFGLVMPDNIKNKVKYAVGNKQFDIFKKRYYYNKEQFSNACIRVQIRSVDDYKNKYMKDPKLPPYEYIDSGFYYDMDPKFNLINLNPKTDNEF